MHRAAECWQQKLELPNSQIWRSVPGSGGYQSCVQFCWAKGSCRTALKMVNYLHAGFVRNGGILYFI